MSEFISGKEAKLAWAEGVDVQVATGPDKFRTLVSSDNLGIFDCGNYFRLKPRTITLNGVEVPAPFNPPENLDNSLLWWVLDTDQECGYSQCRNPEHPSNLLGAWRTEEEIKQVVAALRSVFGKK